MSIDPPKADRIKEFFLFRGKGNVIITVKIIAKGKKYGVVSRFGIIENRSITDEDLTLYLLVTDYS
jgi:hypothetical protein